MEGMPILLFVLLLAAVDGINLLQMAGHYNVVKVFVFDFVILLSLSLSLSLMGSTSILSHDIYLLPLFWPLFN